MSQEKTKAVGVRIFVALVAMALLCSGAALAQTQHGMAGAQVQGVQIAIDPVTGKLRPPTPAEAKALADAFRSVVGRSMASSTEVTQSADGTLIATAGPEFLNIWMASLAANGSLNAVCTEGQEAPSLLLSSDVWEER